VDIASNTGKNVVLPELESQIGFSLRRIVANAGYKGHNAVERH
jgi:hypothetical protein